MEVGKPDNLKCNLEFQFKMASFIGENSADGNSKITSGPKSTDSVAALADQSAGLGEPFNLNKCPERSFVCLGKRSPLERDIFLISKIKKRQRKKSFDFSECTPNIMMTSCIKKKLPADVCSTTQATNPCTN